MKKTLILLMALMVTMLFAACGSEEPAATEEPVIEEAAETEEVVTEETEEAATEETEEAATEETEEAATEEAAATGEQFPIMFYNNTPNELTGLYVKLASDAEYGDNLLETPIAPYDAAEDESLESDQNGSFQREYMINGVAGSADEYDVKFVFANGDEKEFTNRPIAQFTLFQINEDLRYTLM